MGQPLCPSSSPFAWCTYEAMDSETRIIQYLFICVLLPIAFIIIRSIFKIIKNHSKLSNVFAHVHWIAVGWLVGSMTSSILNVVIYQKYMSPDFQQQLTHQVMQNREQSVSTDRSPTDSLVICSIIFTMLRFLAAYFINLLIIIIPHEWLTALLQRTNENSQITLQSRILISRWFKLLAGVRFYYKYIRLIYLVILVLEPFLFMVGILRCDMAVFNFLYVIVESFGIFWVYMLGLRIFYHMNKNNLLIVKSGDFFRIGLEYALLLISVLGRIIINIASISPNVFDYKPNRNCSNTNDISRNHSHQLTVMLILKHAVMHILPILIVLYIYRPTVSHRLSEISSQDQSERGYNNTYKRFYRGANRNSDTIQTGTHNNNNGSDSVISSPLSSNLVID